MRMRSETRDHQHHLQAERTHIRKGLSGQSMVLHPNPAQLNAITSQVQVDQQSSKLKDCWSCRIIGGGFHLAIAAFVGSNYRQMPNAMSKAFILTFSTGK
eukprot:TCALIF_09485-PB protein Name:"Protein of unknown function" AED:0.55 eAED:0.55 QI:0/0/0/0.5/0/0.5/2/0/99